MGRAGWAAAVAGAVLALTTAPGLGAESLEPFAGGWAGGGTVRLMGGGVERLRCRGAYALAGRDQLRLNLACASDSFKVQISSNLVRQGDRVQGSWSEANFGVSGGVSGSVRGGRIDASVSGPGVTAHLSMAVRGSTQQVSLVSQSVILSGAASMALRRY